MNVTTEMVLFIVAIITAISGLWWRIEAAITKARGEATMKAESAAALASLAASQLSEYKVHVAESYISKAGHREATEQIMSTLTRIEGRVDGMSQRMDSVIEGNGVQRQVRKRTT